MDYKLNRIIFVVTLLRLSLLGKFCKAYDLFLLSKREQGLQGIRHQLFFIESLSE